MRIVIINKSDATGGAAVVSRRLVEALRREGADARMLVVEKLTESPYITELGPKWRITIPFLKERLAIYASNGFDRSTLFKIDTGADGLPLWRHPLVKDADAILLNWINQGMLSLEGIGKIISLGKPVVWTMHDMWCMTGVCHHAGECNHFKFSCGDCPLLGAGASPDDLSKKVWRHKDKIYSLGTSIENAKGRLAFVAVSNWLKGKADESSLLCGREVEVIPNAFDVTTGKPRLQREKIRILFGAARLDDPIKGLPVLTAMTEYLNNKYPEIAEKMELLTFGDIRNKSFLSKFSIPHRHLGLLKGKDVRDAYESADIVVSASSYETLPGTLVEAQAYGCVPVSFDRGGQSDIVRHLSTGYLASASDNPSEAAVNLAEGVVWAYDILKETASRNEIILRMRESVERKVSYPVVARQYLALISRLNSR